MNKLLLLLMLGAAATVSALSCLVDSGCLSDADCASPERCFTDGVCRKECGETSTQYCSDERPYCSIPEYRCVECLEVADCEGASADCVNGHCVPIAPDFTLVDQNPASWTFGVAMSLSDFSGRVVLVYFAGLG